MMREIKTCLFSGFLDAGKTTYIQDAIFHDYFCRHGRTLLLSFEDGEVGYDAARLRECNTDAVSCEGGDGGDIAAFCLDAIEKYRPDRIWVECNAMRDGLETFFPPCMVPAAKTALIDGTTLAPYFDNMRQKMLNIVKGSSLVIFNRVPDKAALQPYGNAFRLMERRAAFLWEGPTGYHEKAFYCAFTPDAADGCIKIAEDDYAPFFLDSLEHPDGCAGREIELEGQVRRESGGEFRVGRMVMTCCLADVQFLSFACRGAAGAAPSDNSWIRLRARCAVGPDEYGRKRLLLEPISVGAAQPPADPIIGIQSPPGRRRN